MITHTENRPINEDKEDNRVTYYSDLLDADKYVSQFLNVEDLDLDCDENNHQEESEVEIMVSEPKEEEVAVVKSGEKRKKRTKKYSCFQNFQKHLVITIRSLVDTSKLAQCPETAQCEKKLWRIFLNSNKINKTLVSLIVGDLSLENSQKVFEYGFTEIIESFSEMEVREAQQNLRAEIIVQLREANLDEELETRRLKNKKEFCVYFNAFLAELENGDLEKRMSKCTKLLKSQFL